MLVLCRWKFGTAVVLSKYIPNFYYCSAQCSHFFFSCVLRIATTSMAWDFRVKKKKSESNHRDWIRRPSVLMMIFFIKLKLRSFSTFTQIWSDASVLYSFLIQITNAFEGILMLRCIKLIQLSPMIKWFGVDWRLITRDHSDCAWGLVCIIDVPISAGSAHHCVCCVCLPLTWVRHHKSHITNVDVRIDNNCSHECDKYNTKMNRAWSTP